MNPHSLVALVLLLASGTPASAQSKACFLFPSGGEGLTCTCGPGPYPDAPGALNDVWGSGPYVSKSDICRAALHAGVIGPKGGEVTVIGVPRPKGEWRGSTANGVTTLTQPGPWDTAFSFEGAQKR